jgi:DNA-directed RNA polymerase subunit D
MAMKIKVVSHDEKKNKMVFDVSGIDAGYANTLRRLFMTEVPVIAIEDIEFKKNDSGLYDEIVAHRLGLVAMTTDLKSYNLPAECKCKGEGCARCQLKMTLKAKGPGIVYASDIKSKDPKVKPVFGKTPIVKLLDNQELELEMTAIMGVGKVHTKWSPCLAYYEETGDAKSGSTFRMTIESWGQLDPEEIVAESIKVYDSQIEEFMDKLSKTK